MGVTTFHTVRLNRKITATPGSSDMAWLLHELTHVWQMEHVGMQYMGEALHAQATTGYVYGVDNDHTNDGNGAALERARAGGATFESFNREQQGDIVKHYYRRVTEGRDVTAWQPYIDDLKQGASDTPLAPAGS